MSCVKREQNENDLDSEWASFDFSRELASAAKPKAEQPIEATEIDNNQSESNYQRVDSIVI